MSTKLNILAISYGRSLFSEENNERLRMERCAQSVESFHMVIFTLSADKLFTTKTDSGLILHPTNSKTKFHMLFDAIRIGRQILSDKKKSWVITSQDPFESGVVGYILSRFTKNAFNVQEHGDFYSKLYWRRDLLSNRLRYIVGKFILHRADTIRVVSNRITNALEKFGLDREKILYLPVRTDVIKDIDNSIDLHTQYPEASIIILSMGRLVSQKNLPMLIHAFARLQHTNQRALLLIVGSGIEESFIKKLTHTLGISKNVVFLPWTDNPQALMKSSDIFVLSSNWEGWGRVLIEAMIAGTPVVTTDVGCTGEVFLNDVHGYVVGTGEQELYTEKLLHLASNKALWKKYGTQAQLDVKSIHISEDEYVLQWVNVFNKTYSKFTV